MSIKKRGFFNWLFFQDPDKGKTPDTPGQPHLSADIPRWVKVSVFIDGEQADMKLNTFPFSIGRIESPGGIKIDDKGISRQHATVNLQNGILTVVDANSKNGVTIGENKIMPGAVTPLQRGDSIMIGRAEIIFNDFSQGPIPVPTLAAPAAPMAQPAGGTEFIQPAATPEADFEAPQAAYAPQAAPTPVPSPANPACIGCGASNQPGAKFCRGCGKPMVVAPAPTSGPKPFCSKCGAQNTNLANFCAGCGNSLV